MNITEQKYYDPLELSPKPREKKHDQNSGKLQQLLTATCNSIFRIEKETLVDKKRTIIYTNTNQIQEKTRKTDKEYSKIFLFGYQIKEKVSIKKEATTLTNYSLQNKIGQGTYGDVYCYQSPNGKKRAVKLLKNGNIEGAKKIHNRVNKLHNRCQAKSLSNHRPVGIVKPYTGTYEANGQAALAAPLYQNDMKQFILSGARHSEQQGLSLCYQVLSGVHHFHKAGYAHMDIKPANIFFSEKNGVIKGGIADCDGALNTIKGQQATGDIREKIDFSPSYIHEKDFQRFQGFLGNRAICNLSEKSDNFAVARSLKEYLACVNFANKEIETALHELLDEVIAKPGSERMNSEEFLMRFEAIVSGRHQS